jgi:hypothetical protein
LNRSRSTHANPRDVKPCARIAEHCRALPIVLALACAGQGAQPGPIRSDVQVAPPARSSEPATNRSDAGARARVVIETGGAGDVVVGEAIPAHHLADDRVAKSRYEIRWVADAQPFEAFRIGEPPLLALFEGPFTRWAESNAAELESGRFVDEALREARGGAPVVSIVIETPAARTAAGIGVGSSYSELSAAYPGAKIARLPEWFDSKPTCQVGVPELPGVSFHLAACGPAGNGDVIRVLVSP